MLQELSGGYVKSEIHKGIATIEFGHPQSNSLPGKLLHELANEIETKGNEKEVKVIILRSGGDTVFCSGASFDELNTILWLNRVWLFSAALLGLLMPCAKPRN